jgi:hypothetical protein
VAVGNTRPAAAAKLLCELAHGRARRAGAHGSVDCVSLAAGPAFGSCSGTSARLQHLALRPGDRLMLFTRRHAEAQTPSPSRLPPVPFVIPPASPLSRSHRVQAGEPARRRTGRCTRRSDQPAPTPRLTICELVLLGASSERSDASRTNAAMSPLGVRGLYRVRPHAHPTILAKLACALSRARAAPLAPQPLGGIARRASLVRALVACSSDARLLKCRREAFLSTISPAADALVVSALVRHPGNPIRPGSASRFARPS